jgi:hypothetical protein
MAGRKERKTGTATFPDRKMDDSGAVEKVCKNFIISGIMPLGVIGCGGGLFCLGAKTVRR